MHTVIKNLLVTLVLAGVCGSGALNAFFAENQADAATFAGNSNIYKRYLQLGKLAFENDDAASAAGFLQQALRGLEDAALRRQATDLLLESLLVTHQTAAAEKLLAEAEVSPEFAAGRDALDIMRGRMLMHQKKYQQAIELFKKAVENLAAGDPVLLRALELLGKAQTRSGDYTAARTSYEKLATAAQDNGLWKYKALEGIIFLQLAGDDLAAARQTQKRLESEVPEDIRRKLSARITRLSWLIECHAGNSSKVEKDFLAAVGKADKPDPLLARIAYTIAGAADEDLKRAVKFARIAFDLAEGAFRENALRAVIELEVYGKFWQDALEDTAKFLKIFPASKDFYKVKAMQGALYCHLDRIAEAVQCYSGIIADKRASLAERLAAGEELARIHQKNARSAEAIEAFKFVIDNQTDADRKCAVLQELGEYFYLLGRYNEAAECFSKASASKTFQAKARFWLAQTLYQLKKYDQANAQLKQIAKNSDPALECKKAYLAALLTEKMSSADNAARSFMEFAGKYPQSPEAAESLFQAGVLAMKGSSYQPENIFRQYARLYPGEKAANALYKAVSAVLARGDGKGAGTIIEILDKNYPESKFTIGAHFLMSDFLRETERFTEALAALDEIDSRYKEKHPELIPEILFDRAVLYGKLKNNSNMQKALEKLIREYADQPVAPQAFFLLGNLKMEQGRFEEALNAFNQAHERSGVGIFSNGSAGRAADAAYSLYIQTRSDKYLRQAREGYTNLLKSAVLPSGFRYQSLYKLGKVLEESFDNAGALHQYREILYLAQLAKREKRYFPAVWCAKALDAALKLLIPAAKSAPSVEQMQALRNEAERLLQVARELELPGENISKQLEAVRNAVGEAE